MGAVDLGERRLLLVLGALAGPERADVGGESRLLLGRAVAVLEERGAGLGRWVVFRVVHRVAEVEQALWAMGVGLESAACASVRGGARRSGGGGTAVHGGGDKWRRAEQALAWP
eukprot:scaffold21597_cov56-Phaeocystis_antarctica.AAC.5